MSKKYSGSCLCGGVTFSVTNFNKQAANCYCTMCRKFHGAAFGTLVGVSDLTWLDGEHLLKHYTANNGTIRTFCHDCGSSLGFRVKGALLENIELAIATFDEEIPVTIDAQIFTNNKANWSKLSNDLQEHQEARVIYKCST